MLLRRCELSSKAKARSSKDARAARVGGRIPIKEGSHWKTDGGSYAMLGKMDSLQDRTDC